LPINPRKEGRTINHRRFVLVVIGDWEFCAASLAFFIDIHPIDAHGDLPTRQCKAAVLQKTC
jgi:hypothetical protein